MQNFISDALIWTLGANLLMGLVSLVGIVTLTLNKKLLNEILIFFVALSAGTLLGGAFLHLIPESAEILSIHTTNLVVIIAFIAFFLLEKGVHWHHHHDIEHDTHTLGIMNIFADSIHNFLDGLIIASAFYTSWELGIATTLAIILHEIPQELGDFGVLLHSGFSIKKAVISNIFVALTAVVGGLVGYTFINSVEFVSPYITAFAAGGFIYVATSDLLPEIRQESAPKKAWASFTLFIVGILLMSIL